MKEYVLRDPIHGHISVSDPTVLALISTPEFQRLRRIRQLGTSFISYPGAEHTRFAHSLGVYHLMKGALALLAERGLIALSPEDTVMAEVAALLHDIGHGPFSHLFEKLTGIHHETWVQRIISSPETGIYQALAARDPAWPARIANLIRGDWDGPQYVKDLLSSQLDVDRMDYLLRDSFMCGVPYGQFDLDRLLHRLAVVEQAGAQRVVVSAKGQHAAEEFLLARYFMYWNVYFHKATRSIEAILEKLMQRAVQLLRANEQASLGAVPDSVLPLLRGEPTLSQYLALDETDVIFAIKCWTQAPDPILADLASRFINRRLWAGIEIESESHGAVAARMADIATTLRESGYSDPAYYMKLDETSNLAYSYYVRPQASGSPPIQVLQADGRLQEIASSSHVLAGISLERLRRYVLFVPKEAAPAVQAFLAGVAGFSSPIAE